jgi:ubiquinol-cytochrome c reductase iron-sulfur subunit
MTAKERWVGLFLVLAIVASGGFIAAYVTSASRLLEGVSLTGAAAMFCAAALGWTFWLLPDEQVTDEITAYPSPAAPRAEQSAEIAADEGLLNRHKALLRLLSVALGAFGIAMLVPLRSLGPKSIASLFSTKWRRGSRLVRLDGSAVRISDMNVGSDETVFPEGAVGDNMSQATLIRLPEGVVAGTPSGYIAYSRLCTHAGCPVSLYRAQDEQLICPCHQSIFDVARNGAVVSGPADHALPRLPLVADSTGTLRASGDFPVPVGPGFWERS